MKINSGFRQVVCIVLGAIVGLIGLGTVADFSQNECTVRSRQIYEHPLDAISGIPISPEENVKPSFGPDGDEPVDCDRAATAFDLWLLRWIPMCGMLMLAGAVTCRLNMRGVLPLSGLIARKPEGIRTGLGSAAASAIVAGLLAVDQLLFFLGFPDAESLMLRALVITVLIVLVGGALGYAGGYLTRRVILSNRQI